tara:strand:- start:114 stop:569 length:456 start_codon:yes stop_codon:yes gene_type:complete
MSEEDAQPNYIIAQENMLNHFERMNTTGNYICIKFPVSKLHHILDAIEQEYISYFNNNLSEGVTDFMAENIACWTNPRLTSGNTENNDTVWLAFPNRGNIIEILRTDFLIEAEELNYDKHFGMLNWCGNDNVCLENHGVRCPTCWYRIETN